MARALGRSGLGGSSAEAASGAAALALRGQLTRPSADEWVAEWDLEQLEEGPEQWHTFNTPSVDPSGDELMGAPPPIPSARFSVAERRISMVAERRISLVGSRLSTMSVRGRRSTTVAEPPQALPSPSVRLRVQLEHLLLRPVGLYGEMVGRLVASPRCVLATLDAAPPSERVELAEHVLSTLSAHGSLPERAAAVIHALIDAEVDAAEGNEALLFRANSGVTRLVEAYARRCAASYLTSTLAPCVKKILAGRTACEVDPSKCSDPAELRRNWQRLLAHVTDLWSVVSASAPTCPPALRSLLACVRRACERRFGALPPAAAAAAAAAAAEAKVEVEVEAKVEVEVESSFHSPCPPHTPSPPHSPSPLHSPSHLLSGRQSATAMRAVSGVFFLRFLVPGLLSPMASAITHEPPSEAATRTLLLVSKVMISFANLVEFGQKEPHMEPCNEAFLRPNLPSMRAFTLAISSPVAVGDTDELHAEPHPPVTLTGPTTSAPTTSGPTTTLSSSQEAQLAASLAACFAFMRRRAVAVLERAQSLGCASEAVDLFRAHHAINPTADDPLDQWVPNAAPPDSALPDSASPNTGNMAHKTPRPADTETSPTPPPAGATPQPGSDMGPQ